MESQNPGIIAAAQAPAATSECVRKPATDVDVPTCHWLKAVKQAYTTLKYFECFKQKQNTT